jgi:hypothetical protein
MARPRKVPAVLVEATVSGNAKLAALPSDSARLGYFYVVLGKAKTSEPVPGQFASRIHFRELAGRFARYVDDYVDVGLLEVAPKLCARCTARWSSMPPRRGVLVVHDWHEHQYDPRKIERQREYEDRQKAAQSDAVSDEVSDAQSDAVSDAIPTGDSRGGARDRVVNVERRTKNGESNRSLGRESHHRATDEKTNGAGGPRLTKAQLEAWRSFGPEWDETKAAWLARGFRHPPSGSPTHDPEDSQRALLWEILDARGSELATWIREAPGTTARDVVGDVLKRWHSVKDTVPDDDLPWLRGSGGLEPVGAVLERVIGRG